jgi:class 3 adenylate cyclase
MSDSGTDTSDEINELSVETKLRDYITVQYNNRLNRNGVVTGTDVCQILELLGLPFEDAEVRPILADWAKVSLEGALEAVTTVRITHNADLAHMTQRMEEGIIRLSLCAYISYMLPFTDKDPSWAYRTIELNVDIAPRQLLFASTGIVLLVAGFAILLLMSLLWLGQANQREEVQLENFHLLLHSFTTSFEQRVPEVHAAAMVDAADPLSKMIERQHVLRLESVTEELRVDATLIAGVVNTISGAADAAMVQPAAAGLATLMHVFAAGGTAAELVSTVGAMNAADPQWETVVLQRSGGAATSTTLVEGRTLECAYGTCNYDAMPCVIGGFAAMNATTTTTLMNSQNVRREAAAAIYAPIAGLNAVVCSTMQLTAVEAKRREEMVLAVADINTGLKDVLAMRREVLLVDWRNLSSSMVEYASPPLRFQHACYAAGTCLQYDAFARQTLVSGNVAAKQLTGFSNEVLIVAVAPTAVPYLGVAVDLTLAGIDSAAGAEIITVVNRINMKASNDVELTLAKRDAVTGALQPQLTARRYTADCLVTASCSRFDEAASNAKTAIDTKGAGYAITPNYEPQAVLGAFSYIGYGVEMAIIIERSMASIRSIAVGALISIFDHNNQLYSGSLEAQLVHFDGIPFMRTFDVATPCDHIRRCVRDAALGTLYRSDCVHCSRLPAAAFKAEKLRYLTQLKLQGECDGIRNCPTAALENDGGVWRDVLKAQNAVPKVEYTVDYRRKAVLAVYSFVGNLSVGLVVKLDKSEVEGPINEKIGIAAAIALVIVVVGLVVLIFFSRKVLDKIEHEWLSYKLQIDAEKKKFDAMALDVLPSHITSELRKSQKLAMSLPNMGFVFLDIVGMSDRTKNWSPELVCRYLTYTFTVIDTACANFSLNKVRIFGDTYFAVGGLGESATEEHCVFRCACFGSVVVQLLSRKFAHFPDRVALIGSTFSAFVAKNGPMFPDVTENPEDMGNILMPPMRIGMHYGIGTFCIIETGRTPAYEVFGPGVAMASRMQVTSLGNRIHMTGVMKEILERLDKDRLFDFEPPRKTMVKGQGTMTTYFVKSASVTVPTDMLKVLGIEYANLRVFYDDGNPM